jgi:hypothetical protein
MPNRRRSLAVSLLMFAGSVAGWVWLLWLASGGCRRAGS